MDSRPSVLFVGESPPPRAPADFIPFDCASGDNLARALGLVGKRSAVLEHLPRDNIFATPGVGIGDAPRWDFAAAREAAAELKTRHRATVRHVSATIVALGRKPSDALGCADLPFYAWRKCSTTGVHIVTAPHPSGQSTILHTSPGRTAFRRCVLPELVAGVFTLRPWHFALDSDDVRTDLGAAVSPYNVGLGVAAVTIAAELHRAIVTDARTRERAAAVRAATLRALAVACSEGAPAVSDLFACRSIKSRVLAADRTPHVQAYPIEASRATAGRYFALGVL